MKILFIVLYIIGFIISYILIRRDDYFNEDMTATDLFFAVFWPATALVVIFQTIVVAFDNLIERLFNK